VNLSDRMEFDHVVRVLADGSVADEPGVWAPEVYADGVDVTVPAGWELLTGYSGQYGYSGPVMHPSEFIGGGMARDILASPGVYVAVVVGDLDGDEEPAGWAVARLCDS
jgi:hypothetical protein